MFGYLLAIPKNAKLPLIFESEMDLLYENNGLKYLKSNRMRELDREIGDIKMEIIDTETSAMLRLT